MAKKRIITKLTEVDKTYIDAKYTTIDIQSLSKTLKKPVEVIQKYLDSKNQLESGERNQQEVKTNDFAPPFAFNRGATVLTQAASEHGDAIRQNQKTNKHGDSIRKLK